jgi:AcrR family transcriptional regulator
MARKALSEQAVIAEAARLGDELGATSPTLAVLAESLGVKIPSIYKHVNGIPALHRGIMINAKLELSQTLRRAAVGTARDDAIMAISIAYRRWALAHPGQYRFVVKAPAPEDGADAEASKDLIDIIFKVLAGYDLHHDVAIDAARYLRSAIHGFVSLELAGGFGLPNDLDRSYALTVENISMTLATWAQK